MEEDCPRGISLHISDHRAYVCLTDDSGYRFDFDMDEKRDGHWICNPDNGERFVSIGPANLTDWRFKE